MSGEVVKAISKDHGVHFALCSLLLSVLVACSGPGAHVSPPGELAWTEQFGSNRSDLGYGVAADDSGDVLVVGYTTGDIEGSNKGSQDGFLRRYDAGGNPLWSRQFGTSDSDIARAVAIDDSGSGFVAGNTLGAFEGVNAGVQDAFVRKYDSGGSQLWTRQFGTSDNDQATGVAVDRFGSVVVAGSTAGDLEGINAGYHDVFVRKYDASGSELWTRQFGTSAHEVAYGVAMDDFGNVAVSGNTLGALEGGSAGSYDAFLRKYDVDGGLLWTRQFGTSAQDVAWEVAIDDSGNVVVAGNTRGTLDLVSAGALDVFVRKYDAGGTELWTRQFGTSADDTAYSVSVDNSGNVVVAGYTGGDLGGSSAGGDDALVRKYDADGTELWTRQFGTSGDDLARGVTVDGSDNVVVGGYTNGVLAGTSAGLHDAFARKFGP